MSDYTDKLARQVEIDINRMNEKVHELEIELEDLYQRQEEARATLHFLKTGKSVPHIDEEKKPKRKQTTNAEYLEALRHVPHANFTSADFAKAAGVTVPAAARRLRNFLDEGRIRVIKESTLSAGRGRTSTIFAVNTP